MLKSNVTRKDLKTVVLKNQTVSRIEMKEVIIPPKGKADYHLHPCPVIGHVLSGTLLFQIEGHEPEIIKSGNVFYEPKNQPIKHFDNTSDSENLIFLAYYLLEDNEDLITIL